MARLPVKKRASAPRLIDASFSSASSRSSVQSVYEVLARTLDCRVPWKEQRVMSHKLQFIEKASAMGANISALCTEYGISRQTGH